jgi:hypothetical protein
MVHQHGAHARSVDGEAVVKMATQYRMVKYFVPNNRNYILTPACSAEITMRLTLSEIADWPKAIIKGQTELDLFGYMLWKRCTSYVQDFTMYVPWENMPVSGDGSVLNLQLPRDKPVQVGSSGRNLSSSKLPSANDNPNSPTRVSRTLAKVNYVLRGGFTTWSILPFTDMSDQMYGQLFALGSASLASVRRRMWFVLADRVLYVYNFNSSKPKHVFPMLAVTVSYVEGEEGLFKLRSPSDTLYLVDDNEKTGRMWFRKLYEQSPAAVKKPYDVVVAAMQTPWSQVDAEMEKQLAEERANVSTGTTSTAKKNNLLSQLQKVGTQKFEDKTAGVITK